MKKFHILTDSMCHIPEALRQELEIQVIPLPYVWEGESLQDDEIGPREFYERLRSSKTIPTTSNPTPRSFKEIFDRLGADGKPILAILVGNVFSRTYDAANLAKEMSREVDVTVFNSDSNTLGLGFQVLAAARAARDGKDLKEVVTMLTKLKDSTGIVFAISDIHYLLRGGRISHLNHLITSTFDLIPIMEIHGGPIQSIGRVRTHNKVIPRLLDLVEDRLGERPYRLGIVHTDAEPWAWELAKAARERFQPDEIITSELTPVLGIHTGPDAIGLAYSFGE
jgi:DegV family protein with EDD domain